MNCNCGIPVSIYAQGGVQFAKCGSADRNCGFSQCLGNRMPRSIAPQVADNRSLNAVAYGSAHNTYQSVSAYQQGQQQSQQKPQAQRPPLYVTIGLRKFEGLMPWFSCTFTYDDELTAYFRTLPPDQCKFASSSRIWEISLLSYERVVSHLKSPALAGRLKLDLPPEFLMRKDGIWKWYRDIQHRHQELDAEGGVVLKLNSTLEDKLLDYQTEGIKFVVSRGGRAFIADDMGLGKTIQAIGVLLHYRQHWPALVLMPPGLKENWKKEILENADDLISEREITVVTDGKSLVSRPGSKVTLLPYSLLPALVSNNKINSSTFGIVIADESQKLKNRETAITKSALPILKNAKIALCLSGTPSPNQPVELFTQLSALLPSLFKSYDDFITRYCDGGRMAYIGKNRQVQKLGATHSEELNALMMGMVMIRRQKNVVLKANLPEKQRDFVILKLSDDAMDQLSEIKKEKEAAIRKMHSASAENKDHFAQEVQILTNKLVQHTGVLKVPAFLVHLQVIIQEQMKARQEAEAEADKQEALKINARDGDVLASTDIDVQEIADTFLVKGETKSSAPSSVVAGASAVVNSRNSSNIVDLSRSQGQEDILRDYEGLEGNQEDWRDISLVVSQDAIGALDDDGSEICAVKKGSAPLLSRIEDDGIVFMGTSPATVRANRSPAKDSVKDAWSGSKMAHTKCTDKCRQPCLKHAGTDTDSDSDSDSDAARLGLGGGDLASDSDEESEGAAKKMRKVDDSSSESGSERLFPRSKVKQVGSAAKGSGTKGTNRSAGTAPRKSGRSAKSEKLTSGSNREVTSLLDSDSDTDEVWNRMKQRNLEASERRLESRGGSHSKKSRQATLTERGTLALDDDDDDDFREDEASASAKGKKRKKATSKASKEDSTIAKSKKKKEIQSYMLASKPHHRKLGPKILVFAHHQQVLDQIEAFLRLQDVMFIRMDGSTPAASRDALVHTFQEDDTTLVALCSITAAGTGYTFTRANIALFPEVQWSFGNVEQAEDRIYRLGQKAKVVRCIYYFVPGSGDESIHQALQKKATMVGGTVGHSRATAGGSSSSSSSSDGHSPQRQSQMQLTSYMAPLPPVQPAAAQSYSSAGLQANVPRHAPQRVVDSDSFQYSSGGDSEAAIAGTDQAVQAARSMPAQPAPARPTHLSAASVYGGGAHKPIQASAPASAPTPNIPQSSGAGAAGAAGASKQSDTNQGFPLNQPQVAPVGTAGASMPGRIAGAASLQAASPIVQRPLSPATKARIEANKQIALQRAMQVKAERAAAAAKSAASGTGPQPHRQGGVQQQQNQQNQPNQLASARGNPIVLSNSGVAKAEEWLQRQR